MSTLRADLKAVVVADDLTGAMDSAKAFVSRGWAATVLCGAGAEPAALAAWLQRQPASHGPHALCVDTATRHWADDAAAARVAEVTHLVATAAPSAMHYKKIDSTFRGPWLEEVATWRSALSEALGRAPKDVTLVPAWPREQRIVRGGLLFWRGLPLMDTPMAQDPLGPPRYPSATLTGRAAHGAWGLPAWASLPDCETEEQLHAVLAQAEQGGRWLAGSTAPLDRWCEQHIGPRLPPSSAGVKRLWLAMGSLHPASREQTSRLLASHQIERSFLTPPERQGRTVAERVAVSQALGREVAAALRAELKWEGLCLLAAGGDTALAVAEALGIGEFAVRHCGPFALGVGQSAAGRTLSVVTKPGGFGGSDVWLDWARALRA
jgi:D-threonate/D-erythronate kinase